MLYSKEFLRELDKHRNKITYVRIVALTFDERPLETIEGRVTSGSISLDGSSAIRRTCQVSLVTPKINISNYYWGLNTKIKLAVGIENHIDNNYPDIIWFEQGIFIITSFNAAYSTSTYTINLTGKDKMCLLNGEISGSLGSSVDFGTIEQEIPGIGWKKIKLPVKNIIKEMIHAYAGEPFHNIIINDLEEVGLTLQEYRFSSPMFLLRQSNSNIYSQGFIDQEQKVEYKGKEKTLKELVDEGFKFESLMDDFTENDLEKDTVIWDDKEYIMAKIDYGETAGYTEGDLVYPDDLIANAGESITSVLDKIKNFLGEFEYFYNVQGQFVFQKKKIYVQNTWNPIQQDSKGKSYVEDLSAENGLSYIFNGSELITTFNNTPNLANLKNDFSVWGTNRNDLPIHVRYALDKKPIEYNTIIVEDSELNDYNKKHGLNVKGQSSKKYVASKIFNEIKNEEEIIIGYNCDWREIIYRMALDYNKYNHLDDFETRIIRANPNLYPNGRTGYEQYYIDLQGFWRLLYNPFEDLNQIKEDIKTLSEEIENLKNNIANSEDEAKLAEFKKQLLIKENELNKKNEYYYFDSEGNIMFEDILFGWARAIYERPENILFWFDFMDTQGELEQFSVPAIGDRAKVENDNQIKAIYYKETPNIIFQMGMSGVGEKTGYRYFNVPSAFTMFSKSTQGKSAKEAIDSLLYNYSYCIESVSITSIPIYYLDVNTRIYVSDVEAGIEGEYIISKISMPLSYNGTMNISATKAAQRLL